MRQPWRCDSCGVEGVVEIPNGASVYDGVDLLRESHDALAQECFFDLGKVRVEAPDFGGGG